MAQLPPDMKAFNDRLIAEFRANHGELSGPLAGSRLLLLTTTGATSGEARTTVVGYRRDGGRYLAIASNNGNDRAPFWFRNLVADPNATVEVGSDTFRVKAKVATPQERPRLAKLIDYLGRQQALTSREIPIVILERSQTHG